MSGLPITFLDRGGDKRWHLDRVGIHCGDVLELALDDGGWIRARFEIAWRRVGQRATSDQFPVIHLPIVGGEEIDVTQGMRFRWPAKERTR